MVSKPEVLRGTSLKKSTKTSCDIQTLVLSTRDTNFWEKNVFFRKLSLKKWDTQFHFPSTGSWLFSRTPDSLGPNVSTTFRPAENRPNELFRGEINLELSVSLAVKNSRKNASHVCALLNLLLFQQAGSLLFPVIARQHNVSNHSFAKYYAPPLLL